MFLNQHNSHLLFFTFIKLMYLLSTDRHNIFSRECGGCGSAHPFHRVVFIRCGHAVCRQCADGALSVCPHCKNPSSSVPLIEDDNHSRDCGICYCENPLDRSVLSGCGHIVCGACVMEIKLIADLQNRQLSCPFCRCQSKFVKLEEKRIKNENSK